MCGPTQLDAFELGFSAIGWWSYFFGSHQGRAFSSCDLGTASVPWLKATPQRVFPEQVSTSR